jgi:N-carbamoylputrescine amidase
MKFWGGSFVSNPFGTVLAQASHDKEEVIVRRSTLKKRTHTALTGHSS